MWRHPAQASDIEGSSRPSLLKALDPASILLVLSCYLRVLEIYGKVFLHLNACINLRQGKGSLVDICMPVLNFGAFSLESSRGLQITLIVQIAEQLLGRLREIILTINTETRGKIGSEDISNGSPSFPNMMIVETTLQAIKVQDSETAKNIAKVKRSLQQSRIM
jgi:hypothetical protein